MLLFEVGSVELQGIATVVLFGLLFYLMTELRALRREIRSKQVSATANNSALVLQAYERLALFAERAALKNLVSRLHSSILSARELQIALVDNIKAEFEHNTTQQIYVNPEIWKAVTKMKDQNIFIIHQLAGSLPDQSTATDLSNILLEYSSRDNAELSPVVLDAIQYEVKKLL